MVHLNFLLTGNSVSLSEVLYALSDVLYAFDSFLLNLFFSLKWNNWAEFVVKSSCSTIDGQVVNAAMARVEWSCACLFFVSLFFVYTCDR